MKYYMPLHITIFKFVALLFPFALRKMVAHGGDILPNFDLLPMKMFIIIFSFYFVIFQVPKYMVNLQRYIYYPVHSSITLFTFVFNTFFIRKFTSINT